MEEEKEAIRLEFNDKQWKFIKKKMKEGGFNTLDDLIDYCLDNAMAERQGIISDFKNAINRCKRHKIFVPKKLFDEAMQRTKGSPSPRNPSPSPKDSGGGRP